MNQLDPNSILCDHFDCHSGDRSPGRWWSEDDLVEFFSEIKTLSLSKAIRISQLNGLIIRIGNLVKLKPNNYLSEMIWLKSLRFFLLVRKTNRISVRSELCSTQFSRLMDREKHFTYKLRWPLWQTVTRDGLYPARVFSISFIDDKRRTVIGENVVPIYKLE